MVYKTIDGRWRAATYIEAGALVRGAVLRAITKSQALFPELDITVSEAGGFLESVITITVVGEEEPVREYMAAFNRWAAAVA